MLTSLFAAQPTAYDAVRSLVRGLQRRKRSILGRTRDWTLLGVDQSATRMSIPRLALCLQGGNRALFPAPVVPLGQPSLASLSSVARLPSTPLRAGRAWQPARACHATADAPHPPTIAAVARVADTPAADVAAQPGATIVHPSAIHPSAIVDADATIGRGVRIGARDEYVMNT